MSKYLWTVKDNRVSYCRSCDCIRNTYCEEKFGGEILVCCCHCQYIIAKTRAVSGPQRRDN